MIDVVYISFTALLLLKQVESHKGAYQKRALLNPFLRK